MARWAEIDGYEGLYLISDSGNVIALPKTVKSDYRTCVRKAKPLKKCLRGRHGLLYEAVTLSKDGVSKRYSIHRLVAQAFIPNPNNYPEVNHKDENPRNNNAENLEWCTRQYNIEYSKAKPVLQISKVDGSTKYHKSVNDASTATGINRRSISNALCGWANTAGGYCWKYAD